MSDDSKWIDDLYAEGRDEMPPPALDQQIRAAARKDIKRPWYGNTGRLASVATAASLVIAAMVIYYVPQESLKTLDADLPQKAESEAEAEQISPTGTLTGTSDQADATAEKKDILSAKRLAEPSARTNGPAEADSAAATYSSELERSVNVPAPAAARMAAAPQAAERQRGSVDELREEELRETVADAGGRRAAEALEDSTADIEKDLAERCGPLPGSDDNRSIGTDTVGWYLTVSEGNENGDIRHWRCQDGAWIEIEGPNHSDE